MSEQKDPIVACAARGIKFEMSGDDQYPWAAVVSVPRREMPLVRVLEVSQERAAVEALKYIGARGWK